MAAEPLTRPPACGGPTWPGNAIPLARPKPPTMVWGGDHAVEMGCDPT